MDEFYISIKHGMCAHYVNYCEIPEIAVGLYYINYQTSKSCNQSYISLNAFWLIMYDWCSLETKYRLHLS